MGQDPAFVDNANHERPISFLTLFQANGGNGPADRRNPRRWKLEWLKGLEGLLSFTYPARRDFSESQNHLPIVRVDKRFGSFEKLLGPMRGEYDQIEAIGNSFETIFHSDTRHALTPDPSWRTRIQADPRPTVNERSHLDNADCWTYCHGRRKDQPMIRDLLRKAQERWKLNARENGDAGSVDPAETLKLSAHMLWRLAEQIEAHSAQAPYPQLSTRLREIAFEKQKTVDFLKKELSRLGHDFGQPQRMIQSGKNHWERMGQDVEDQKLLEDNLLVNAARLAESAPEISALLRRIVSEQRSHAGTLLDMLVRADPQAHQT